MPRLERNLIELPILHKLPRPATTQDSAECLHIIAALRTMEIVDTRFDEFLCRPAAFIRFTHGRAPEPFWNKWLWGRIKPTCSEFSWLGRLAGINPHQRELIFVPRPDKIDESLAKMAKEKAPDKLIQQVVLGLVYPPHQFMRHFPTFQ
ncbi:MAG: hypothetical protein WC551_00930 [Patescibacteria group bacterium]